MQETDVCVPRRDFSRIRPPSTGDFDAVINGVCLVLGSLLVPHFNNNGVVLTLSWGIGVKLKGGVE